MFVKDSLTVHGRDTTSIMYQCTIMGTYMPKNVYIPVILFVFITCSCNLKSSAMNEGFEFGKKLPLVPFMFLDKFGLQMCFRECEAYGACLSINYNRRHLVCELNNGWKNSTLSLINDSDYVYKEILRPANKTCGAVTCNSYSKCVRSAFGNSVCIPVVILQVRLVNGSHYGEGRVEVLYNNVWGTVCDDIWNTNNAQVVCRMLGYKKSAIATTSAYFGQGNGQIWMDDVNCIGNETMLTDCQFLGFGIHNCVHAEDAGVICQ